MIRPRIKPLFFAALSCRNAHRSSFSSRRDKSLAREHPRRRHFKMEASLWMTTTRHSRRYCQCHSISSLSASLSARRPSSLSPSIALSWSQKAIAPGLSWFTLQRHVELSLRSKYARAIFFFREQTECILIRGFCGGDDDDPEALRTRVSQRGSDRMSKNSRGVTRW